MRASKPKRIEWSRIETMQLPYKRCVICGTKLERKYYGIRSQRIGCKIYNYQHWETTARFLERKTCSKECKRKLQSGSGNPNYKGIMPRCIDCGKKIAYKPLKNKKRKWGAHKRCWDCHIKWAEKTNYFKNRKQAKYIVERMKKRKGIYPEHLKPFAFQKGQLTFKKNEQSDTTNARKHKMQREQ